ncbi:MAG: hypothetical protein LUE27_04310 [Clostridia bacterium]|nr:hypothetical protein [Clostridia bacterium]
MKYDDESVGVEDVDLDDLDEEEGLTDAEDIIDQLTEDELRAFLKELAGKDPKIANLVTVRFSKDSDMDDMWSFEEELDGIDEKYSPYASGASFLYAGDLHAFLDRYAGFMISDGKFKAANELLIEVYERIGQTDEFDHDGEFYDVMQDCLKYWREIDKKCHEMPDKLEILDRIKDTSDYEHQYVDDLEGIMEEGFQEKECLMRKIEWTDEQISHWENDQVSAPAIRDPSLGTNVSKKLELMYRMGCSKDEIDAVAKKYWRLPYVRLWKTDNLILQGQTEEAEKLLEESKETDAGDGYFLIKETVRLISAYEMLGRTEDYKRELAGFIFRDSNINPLEDGYSYDMRDYVKKLKAACKPKEWARYREKILEKGVVNRYDFMLEEGLYERLMDELTKEPVYVMDKYEASLRHRFPEQLRKYYEDYVTKQAFQVSTRKEYAALMRYLKKIFIIPGGSVQAAEIADKWKKQFPGKPAFLDELHKAGF